MKWVVGGPKIPTISVYIQDKKNVHLEVGTYYVVVKKEDNHYVHVQLNEFKKYKTWEPKVRFYTVIVLSCRPLITLSVAQQPIREQLETIAI